MLLGDPIDVASCPRLSEAVTAEPTVRLLHLYLSLVLGRREVWLSTPKPELLGAARDAEQTAHREMHPAPGAAWKLVLGKKNSVSVNPGKGEMQGLYLSSINK